MPVIDCKAGERKHLIAEEHLARPSGSRAGGVHDLGGPGPGHHLGRAAIPERGDPQPGQEEDLCQPLQLPHHRPPLGARHHQDVRPPALRGAGHPQRPRARGRHGRRGWRRVREGGKLLHGDLRSRRPGPARRHLVATCGYRASGPGLRPVDLHRLLVLRAGPVRPGTVPVRLRLLHLPGRVQPQPALRARAHRWTGSSTPWSTAPGPASTCPSCAPCSAPRQRPRTNRRRPVPSGGSRDRDTSATA